MDFLLEALTNWLKEMLVGGIMSNLSGMFDSVNQQVADKMCIRDRCTTADCRFMCAV